LELTKAILERALVVEMTDHPGYAKYDPAGHPARGMTTRAIQGHLQEIY
jgi:transposase-like protein